MTPERLKQIESLFHQALALDPGQREAFLNEACAGDPDLRADVESLIVSDERAEQEERAVRKAIGGVVDEFVKDTEPTSAGTRIGPYQLVREVGRGGMGAVYLAERADEQYHQRVALKLVKRGLDTDEVLRRFRHERQILANLDHPNIARLLDGGTTEDGRPYFVMEYIEGQPINEYCDTHNLSILERLKLFRTVCSAVHYAHQNLVVHRDLKPSNIWVTSDGAPKLLDFGIAKLLHPEPGAPTLTATAIGLRPMTPEYASPEQIRGEPITTASDVYSLGVLLYELLTGQRPYQLKSHTPQEIERVITEEEPERPSAAASRQWSVVSAQWSVEKDHQPRTTDDGQRTAKKLRRQLEGDLDNIVLMAMRKEPQRRYGSVEQFSEDIRRHLAGLPVIARKDTLGYRAGKFIQRHKVGVVVAAAFVAVAIGFGVTMTVQSARIARERDTAARERDRAVAAEQLAAERQADAERARDAERGQRQRAEINLTRAEEAEHRATAEANRANTEAARAKTEAETAKRVSEFLVSLFEVADPRQARGNTITAREILDKGAAKITTELKDQPTVQATLMDTIGQVYGNLGLYDNAAPLLKEALNIRKQHLGEEHLDVATSLQHLGLLLHHQGDYAAAESLYRQAVALRKKLLGDNHPLVADGLRYLGSLLGDRGDYQAAEPVLRQALALQKRIQEGDPSQEASILDGLASVLHRKGDYAAAESFYREALALRQQRLNDPFSTAHTMGNLGAMLLDKGDYQVAESLLREALEMNRQLLDEEHPRVIANLNNLALLRHNMGDYDEAESLYRQALALARKSLGEEHWQMATNLNNLALLLHDRGDFEAAEQLFREVLARQRKAWGSEHPNVGFGLNNLARVLHDQGRYDAAESLYRQGLDLRQKTLPKGHASIAESLAWLGKLLTDRGDPQAGEPLLREALEIRRRALAAGDWRTAETESLLGGCLVALGRYAEAESLLVNSYPVMKTKRGERYRRTLQALSRVVDLYDAWGKPEKAAPYRALLAKSESSTP